MDPVRKLSDTLIKLSETKRNNIYKLSIDKKGNAEELTGVRLWINWIGRFFYKLLGQEESQITERYHKLVQEAFRHFEIPTDKEINASLMAIDELPKLLTITTIFLDAYPQEGKEKAKAFRNLLMIQEIKKTIQANLGQNVSIETGLKNAVPILMEYHLLNTFNAFLNICIHQRKENIQKLLNNEEIFPPKAAFDLMVQMATPVTQQENSDLQILFLPILESTAPINTQILTDDFTRGVLGIDNAKLLKKKESAPLEGYDAAIDAACKKAGNLPQSSRYTKLLRTTAENKDNKDDENKDIYSDQEKMLIKAGYLYHLQRAIWQKVDWKIEGVQLEKMPITIEQEENGEKKEALVKTEEFPVFKRGSCLIGFAIPGNSRQEVSIDLNLNRLGELNFEQCQTIFNFISEYFNKAPEDKKNFIEGPQIIENYCFSVDPQTKKKTRILSDTQFEILCNIAEKFAKDATIKITQAYLSTVDPKLSFKDVTKID